jgi:tetratricopeptide (TPR) repeat protein/RsiW-degrading membrane proteinase PrsW (M82 family)
MNIVLSSRILALPAALIAGALVALVILRLGRKSFSPRLFGVAIACGAMIAFLPAAIGVVEAQLHLSLTPFWDAAVKAFVLAGLAEEGAKLAAAYFLVRPYYERRTARDLVLGVAAVALGFALLENVLYVFAAADRWPATALARMATAVPIHALIGLVLGAGLARADSARSGAMRALLLARAWLIAALLHGFYDFPLFLALHAPLYPTPINQFAIAFSTTTPTLLAIIYLAAVIAACIGATRVIVWLRGASEAESGLAARPLWPNWLGRLVFARATGLALAVLLLLPSAIWVALAVNATIAGIMPVMTLEALSVCAASAMLGAIFLLRATPRAADAAPAIARPARASRKGAAIALGAFAVVGVAIVAFGGAIESARRNVLAYALVVSGNAYSSQGDLDRSLENYDSALAYKPDFIPALFQRAMANKTYQRYERTLEDLNSAVRLAPDDPAILGERANAFENLHQPENAVADLDRALTIKPDEPALLSVRAEILMNRGDFEKAAADLDRALTLKPDFALARAARGDLFLQKFEYENALRELDESIRIDPTFASAYFTRGRVRYYRGEFAAAVSDFQQANGRQPYAYSALWLYLARARAGQNGRDELIFWASRLSRNAWPFPVIEVYLGARSAPSALAVAANPDQLCEADYYIAEWLILQKLEDPATIGLKRAAAVCPKSFIEQNGAVAELKRLASASAAQSGAPLPAPFGAGASAAANGGPQPTRRDPDAARHFDQGATQQAQGKFDEAIAEYRTAIRLDPTHARAHRNLGEILKQQGMFDDAIVELREAVRLESDDAETHRLLGDVHLEQRAFDDSIAEYREAIRLQPTDAALHRFLGEAILEFSRGETGTNQVIGLSEACDQFAQGAELASSDPNFPILEGVVEASLGTRGHCPP